MTALLDIAVLLKNLGCRTSPEDIPAPALDAISDFLANELLARKQHRIARLLVSSGILKQQIRTFEQFDWNFNPKTPKQEFLTFRNSPWLEKACNLVLIGDAGIGKSHLAKALCYDAILKGHSAYFISTFDLVSKIKKSPHPAHRIDYYAKAIHVLCLDELGYTFHQKEDTDLIFQIISKRTELLPTIVTSNLSPKQWGSIFSGSAASAILDRLSFNGSFLTWEGKSYRLLKKNS